MKTSKIRRDIFRAIRSLQSLLRRKRTSKFMTLEEANKLNIYSRRLWYGIYSAYCWDQRILTDAVFNRAYKLQQRALKLCETMSKTAIRKKVVAYLSVAIIPNVQWRAFILSVLQEDGITVATTLLWLDTERMLSGDMLRYPREWDDPEVYRRVARMATV